MITSKQNALIKKIRSLSDKKYRDENNLYIAEGVKMVKEAFISNQKVIKVVCTEKCADLFKGDNLEIVSEDVFKYVSGEVSPQGVLCLIEKPECGQKCQAPAVLLDGVSDPANVGAIIRTAAASGYNDIYLTEDCADPYSPKSVRASMSGVYKVRIHNVKREDVAREISYPLIIADMGGENIYSFVSPKEFCLVIGNEGKGVSDFIQAKAKYTVSIPMENQMESLNAGVSAGILMYALKNRIN